MAYCLRLPGNAAQLIEEMRAHWKDLAELKAAGGTPAARCTKDFKIILLHSGSIIVKPKNPRRHYICACDDALASPCPRCLLWMEGDEATGCGGCQFRPVHIKAVEYVFDARSRAHRGLP